MRIFYLSLIWLMSFLCLFRPVFAQQKEVIHSHSLTLGKALNVISGYYKVNFLYEETTLTAKEILFDKSDFKNETVNSLLNKILGPLNLTSYQIDRSNYSIFPVKVKDYTATVSNLNSAKDSLLENKISGRVFNEAKQPQQFATITLLRLPDSVAVNNVLTDTSGAYQFAAVKKGIYMIRITCMGYRSKYSPKMDFTANKNIIIQDLAMDLLPRMLKNVQVTASRPMVETRSDRFVVNVENSAMASGNSIQLLRSAPFVQVSQDDEVTLQGRKTMILIDNKPIPEDALDNILKTLPAGNISKIELITRPSAKYDASYGAVINIITKKNQIEGLTGSLRLDGSQGIYSSGSLNESVTYKHKNLTLYSNIGYTRADNMYSVTSERTFSTNSLAKVLTNDWTRLSHNNLYFFQFGGEITIGKNQTLGTLINPNIYYFSGKWGTVNKFHQQGMPVDSVLTTTDSFHQKASVGNYNFNYHLVTDSGINELTTLVTFTPLSRNFNQYFPSVLTDADYHVIRIPVPYQTINTADIKVWIGQLDYTRLLKKQWKLENGIKYQATHSKAIVIYNTVINGNPVKVPAYSSDNELDENIAGAYSILTKNWKDDELQAGIRLEKTNASLLGNFDRQYFNAFPTLLYQHNINADDNVSFSFKRTISRAPYFQLVPYTVFINQYTIEQGNPELRPEFDNIYSLNTNIHRFNLSLSYTSANGLIGLFPIRQDFNTGVTYFSRRNLDQSSDLALYLYFPFELTSWWRTENSGTVAGFNTAQGLVFGKSYILSAFHSDFRVSQIFKVSKQVKLEVDTYYWTRSVQDLSHQSGYKNLDASLLIDLWDGKGQLRIGGNQIVFKRNDYLTTRDYGTYNSRDITNTDSRRVNVGFTYNFGRTTIKSPGKRLGNEDAVKRL